jgi:putative transposase
MQSKEGLMPRQPRVVAPGYPHHVTQRGNNRESVFLDRQDYQKYLELLKVFTVKHQAQVVSYCLMPNHVHLLIVPENHESLSQSVGITNLTYTQYFNQRYKRTGRIWQNRFFSCVVSKDAYFWSVVRYIEQNPVKAGIVKDELTYQWSSVHARILQKEDTLLSMPDWMVTSEEYRNISQTKSETDEQIRKATLSGRYFGNDVERERLEKSLNIKLTAGKRGRPKRK